MNEFVIKRQRDGIRLSHVGEKHYKNYTLYVNGKIFKHYREGSAESSYRTDKDFIKFMNDEVKYLKSFFKGKLTHTSVKDTNPIRK